MTQPPHRYEKIILLMAIREAIESGEAERDPVLHAQRLQRFIELDQAAWVRTIANHPELAPYQTLTEGILHIADVLQLPLPPIEDESLEVLGGPRAGFSYTYPDRSLRVFAFGNEQLAPYYAVDLFDATASYQGNAPALVEVTRLISDWLVQGASIEALGQRYPWLRPEPVRVAWRVRLDEG